MSEAQIWMLASPVGSGAVALATVLALSLLSPPWVRRVGRSREEPSPIDRWKLFSFLHPVLAALLRWTGAIALGAVVSIAALVIEQHDIVGQVQQAALETLHRVWKPD